MKNFKLFLIVASFIAIFLFYKESTADIVYSFEGRIDRVLDNYSFISNKYKIGDPVYGHFSYTTNAVEHSSYANDPTVAIYSAVTNYYLNINGPLLNNTSVLSYLQVWDDRVIAQTPTHSLSFSSGNDYNPVFIPAMGENRTASSKIMFVDRSDMAPSGLLIPSQVNYDVYKSVFFSALQLINGTNQSFYLTGPILKIKNIQSNTTDLIPMITVAQDAQTINLDATKSYSTTDNILSYEWNLSDGRVMKGINTAFTLNTPGNYVVTLTITDTKGNTSSVSENMIISIPIPASSPSPSIEPTPTAASSPSPSIEPTPTAASSPSPSIEPTSTSIPEQATSQEPPRSIDEVETIILEQNSGEYTIYFFLEVNPPPINDISVDYYIRPGTAQGGVDYIDTSGTATIRTGNTYVTIPIQIIGDTMKEGTEDFYLVIHNPKGANFPMGVTEIIARRVIIDDD